MVFLLIALIFILSGADLYRIDLSLAPGLSVKNSLLYLLAMLLALQTVVGGGFKREIPRVLLYFGVLIAYAIATWIIAGRMIEYSRYEMFPAFIKLKTLLLDPAIFFFVFFFAIRTIRSAIVVTRAIAIAWVLTSVITAAVVFGLYDIGFDMMSTDGGDGYRMAGALQNPNETAALIICLLPPLIVAAWRSGSGIRLVWIAGIVVSVAVLVLSASRGAFVGLVVGSVWAAILCKRFIPLRVATPWLIGALVFLVVGALLVELAFPGLLADRFVARTSTLSAGEVSSGRTDLWLEIIERMMATPLSLLTGFGWGVYDVMPFRFGAHNHYLWLWFDLGLLGLVMGVLVLREPIRLARLAAENASGEIQGYLVAFIFGFMMLAIAVFFGNMFETWLYAWAYAGTTTRIAVLVLEAQSAKASLSAPSREGNQLPSAASASLRIGTRSQIALRRTQVR